MVTVRARRYQFSPLERRDHRDDANRRNHLGVVLVLGVSAGSMEFALAPSTDLASALLEHESRYVSRLLTWALWVCLCVSASLRLVSVASLTNRGVAEAQRLRREEALKLRRYVETRGDCCLGL